jgi:hypothetical protein
MKLNIFISRFDPSDFFSLEKNNPAAGFNDESI